MRLVRSIAFPIPPLWLWSLNRLFLVKPGVLNGGHNANAAMRPVQLSQASCEGEQGRNYKAEPLADVRTLQRYTDWMQRLMKMMPDGRYELESYATDSERGNVTAYTVFSGTHTGAGGPPPTGKSTRSDYVYMMAFEGNRIGHMTKIWKRWALKELGW